MGVQFDQQIERDWHLFQVHPIFSRLILRNFLIDVLSHDNNYKILICGYIDTNYLFYETLKNIRAPQDPLEFRLKEMNYIRKTSLLCLSD